MSIREVIEIGKSGKITYPELVNLLVKSGVTNYVADVTSRTITYFGKESFVEQSPGGPLAISDNFSKERVILAIKRTQMRETTYPEFLEEIAKAGVYKYEVDLTARKIKYIAKEG